MIFALRPLGGSFVILTPFYRMAVGKEALGYDVNQSLKSGCVVLGFNSSQILSKVVIQETAKWQFWRTTHPPSTHYYVIFFYAKGPWPYPNEI